LYFVKPTESLTAYLNRNILIPFIVFGLLFAALSIVFYWFALDDTAEFYLFEDAEQFISTQQKISSGARKVSDVLLDFSLSNRTQLNNLSEVNTVYFFETEKHDSYFLIYQAHETAKKVYVVHQFDKGESFDIRPLLLYVCLSSLFLFAFWLSHVLSKVRNQLARFVKSINTRDIATELHFSELDTVKKVTLSALENEQQAIAREKAFSSFLSHEIRHPLTLLGHQLSQFDHMDDLTEQVLMKVAELKTTQQTSVKLANTILGLWVTGDKENQSSTDFISFLNHWQKKYSDSLLVEIKADTFFVSLNEDELNLLMAQIDSNFRTYGEGNLSITVCKNSVSFSNRINTKPNNENNFGVGTFIINALSAKAGISVAIKRVRHRYTLLLNK